MINVARLRTALLAVALCTHPAIHAQSEKPAKFDVVSIRRNIGELGAGGGIRTLPDGTFIMTNQPIGSIIGAASPVPVSLQQVVGLPDWVKTERYDVTAKPPAGTAREHISQMMRAMFADRMKLVAHVEEREQGTFSLVLARSDGRLGPQLKPSTLDCSPRPPGSPPLPEPQTTPSIGDVQNRCGMAMSAGTIVSGGIAMDQLVRSLAGLAGGLVNNRTGLQGFYALTLTFSQTRRVGAPPDVVAVDDAPEIFTALKEQLGLKLQPEKTMVPVFVVDQIERPSEN